MFLKVLKHCWHLVYFFVICSLFLQILITIFFTSTGSGMGSKYLTFLDLGLQTNLFNNVDDGTIAIELPSPLNVGGQLFHSLNVRFSHHISWYHNDLYFDLDKLKWVS